ncbi:MAG: nuclear transport factor 2 family protein [Variovorax paradoxus]|uniref:Nuclear transport factor 2 family protein n=1 Tax=Variovorax paradoxus TaxID=34073 RepID=A0A2W5QQ12_VARPD|nr:MAG: nuclear transport factor 2 family protein [Variovorax paradoxus]
MSTLDEQQHLAIESHCMRLVHDFAAFVDRREFDRLANLFTVDGHFSRPRLPDVVVAGRDRIRASFTQRPSAEFTRHLVHNLRVTVTSPTHARGEFCLVLYTAKVDPHAGEFGACAEARQLIADIEDDFALTDEGWRIASRRGRIVMHT